jgi:hypothetical protein
MNMTLFILLGLLLTYLGVQVLQHLWVKFAPTVAKNLLRVYLNACRRAVPDTVYKMWLREGRIDDETYRVFQEYNIIEDELDPEYIHPNRADS